MRGPILGVAMIAFLVAILKPRIEELGVFRTVPNFNNNQCRAIKGLESCEDIFVDHPTGIAYLACSRLKQRAFWVPALDIINYEKLPARSDDYVAILDLKTHNYRELSLTNLSGPLLKDGVYLHGLDLFIHPSEPLDAGQSSIVERQRKATLYLINHRPPTDSNSNSSGTADSVVEVFDTSVGSNEAAYRTTIKHNLILTPNNLVAMDENSFYVTNDHGKKKHWTRKLDMLYPSELDGVVYCTSSQEKVECISALHGRYSFPNGIAKGPSNLIYMANSINSYLRFLEIQPDHTLKLKEEIKVPRHLDNIYVTKTGSVFLASVPRMLEFLNLFGEFHKDELSLFSPSEVWRLSNETDVQTRKTNRFKLEKVFGDDGKLVSGITSVAVWNSKLFLTGIGSAHVSVCHVQQELAV